ncbi:hypothetical protein PX52LOC_07713 [Limnoglobus roseus]|uniref:DUF1653 domain-containing protein n=2 Tax=Limnoglobus roseus TaxID=2598579 RepID=A0A5C1AUX9_9BACT|nr:hypothetical protein PX52LOC_07713 [Limnoglobus roseus]
MKAGTEIPRGRYRHCKGQEYEVVDVARHHETHEEVVVYRALYGDRLTWVRPLANFVERVPAPGGSVARLLYVGTTGDEFPAVDFGTDPEGGASA